MTHKNRKRGAPFGNHNALKHGFYSAAFRHAERQRLSQLANTDLSGEIDLIRVHNFRFLEALNHADTPLDLPTQLAAVRAANLSAQSILSLIRAQALTSLMLDAGHLAEFQAWLASCHDPQLPSPESDDALSPVAASNDPVQQPSSASESECAGASHRPISNLKSKI